MAEKRPCRPLLGPGIREVVSNPQLTPLESLTRVAQLPDHPWGTDHFLRESFGHFMVSEG